MHGLHLSYFQSNSMLFGDRNNFQKVSWWIIVNCLQYFWKWMSLWKCWPSSSRQNPSTSCFRDLMLFCFFYPVASWSMTVFCSSKNSCLSVSRMTILVSTSVDCFEILWKWRLGLSCDETCPKLSLSKWDLNCFASFNTSDDSGTYWEKQGKHKQLLWGKLAQSSELHLSCSKWLRYATERNEKHRGTLNSFTSL